MERSAGAPEEDSLSAHLTFTERGRPLTSPHTLINHSNCRYCRSQQADPAKGARPGDRTALYNLHASADKIRAATEAPLRPRFPTHATRP